MWFEAEDPDTVLVKKETKGCVIIDNIAMPRNVRAKKIEEKLAVGDLMFSGACSGWNVWNYSQADCTLQTIQKTGSWKRLGYLKMI